MYRLHGIDADRFSIDHNGSIYTMYEFDRELKPQYQLYLNAIDENGRGRKSANISLQVVIDDSMTIYHLIFDIVFS